MKKVLSAIIALTMCASVSVLSSASSPDTSYNDEVPHIFIEDMTKEEYDSLRAKERENKPTSYYDHNHDYWIRDVSFRSNCPRGGTHIETFQLYTCKICSYEYEIGPRINCSNGC